MGKLSDFENSKWRLQYGRRIFKKCCEFHESLYPGVLEVSYYESDISFWKLKMADAKWCTRLHFSYKSTIWETACLQSGCFVILTRMICQFWANYQILKIQNDGSYMADVFLKNAPNHLKIRTQGFSGSLITNLIWVFENSKWQLQNRFALNPPFWIFKKSYQIRNQRPRKPLDTNFHVIRSIFHKYVGHIESAILNF